MIEYALLDREKAEVYKDYLTPEVYGRRQDRGVFFYGASTEEEIVGVAAFEVGEESELLSVAVSQDWQRQGIGSELVYQISTMLKQNGGFGIQTFLSGTEEEMEGLNLFLWRCGFTMEEERPIGSFTLRAVQQSPVLKKVTEAKRPAGIQALADVPPLIARAFGNELVMRDLYYGWNSGRIQTDLSSVYREGERILGCLLLSESDTDEVTLEFAYVDGENENQLALLHMMARTMERLEEKYPLETQMVTIMMNEVSEKILFRIVGENLGQNHIRRYAMNLQKENQKSA